LLPSSKPNGDTVASTITRVLVNHHWVVFVWSDSNQLISKFFFAGKAGGSWFRFLDYLSGFSDESQKKISEYRNVWREERKDEKMNFIHFSQYVIDGH
jgi:hypothetical protein